MDLDLVGRDEMHLTDRKSQRSSDAVEVQVPEGGRVLADYGVIGEGILEHRVLVAEAAAVVELIEMPASEDEKDGLEGLAIGVIARERREQEQVVGRRELLDRLAGDH